MRDVDHVHSRAPNSGGAHFPMPPQLVRSIRPGDPLFAGWLSRSRKGVSYELGNRKPVECFIHV